MLLSGRLLGVGLIALTALSAPQARADDPSIPERCRPHDAEDNPRCAAIIDSRSAARNRRLNARDAKANAELRDRILASKTATGEAVADALAYASQHIPFSILGWYFVYARSGAEYAVLSYGKSPGHKASDDRGRVESFLDYDLETDPVFSLRNSHANGMVVWKVEGGNFEPWGSDANMLALGQMAFTWAVNDGRRGFQDSGFDPAIARDLSFLGELPVGTGKLSDSVDLRAARNLSFFWNVVDGYTLLDEGFGCPGRKVGEFTVTGKDCAAKAAAARDIQGRVLPFKVIRAIRNLGFVRGMVLADVSISVEGGEPGDWLATAVYVAEHSIIHGATFSEVSVFVPNAWADFPPQRAKMLAKVYYAPDPDRAPWKEKWTIIGARRAASPADIEYDELANDLIEDPAKVPDPDQRLRRAEDAARRRVIAKYGLPSGWNPSENLGLDGQEHSREHLHIQGPEPGDTSLTALTDCLSMGGGWPFQGCMPESP